MKHLDIREIRKGLWGKKKYRHHKLYDFLHTATPIQIGFMREVARQASGEEPSNHYGKIPFPHKISKRVASSILNAKHLPELASNDKHAAGFMSSVGNWVSNQFEHAPTWAKTAAKYVGAHSEDFIKYAKTASDVAQGVAGAGQAFGWWGKDVVDTVGDIGKAVSAHQKSMQKKKVASEALPAGSFYL